MPSSKLKPFFTGVLAALLLVVAAWPVWAGLDLRQPAEISGRSRFDISDPIQSGVQSAFQNGVSLQVIPAAAFAADGFAPDSGFFSFGGYFTGNSGAYGCVEAPVYLPANVPVKAMFVSVYDNDATRTISTALRRVDNFSGAVSTMATVSTSGASAGIQVLVDDTVNFPVVLAPDFSYFLTTCLGSTMTRLYSVRLYYGHDTYLPIIRKK